MKRTSRGRRWLKWLAVLAALYLAFEGLRFAAVSFPYPLFPHRSRHGGVLVYSDAELDFDLQALFAEVEQRRALIDIADPKKTQRVFFCSSDRLYGWLTRLQGLASVAQGFSQPHLGNVFVSLPNVERIRRRFGPAEYRHTAFAGDLAQVVTHEMVHNDQATALGTWRARFLPTWKKEGYCEFASNRWSVLGDPDYDFAARVERAMDERFLANFPVRQLYYRSQILTEFLMDVRGLSFEEVTDDAVVWETAWRELRTWHRAGDSSAGPRR